jgi:hypothetical protein
LLLFQLIIGEHLQKERKFRNGRDTSVAWKLSSKAGWRAKLLGGELLQFSIKMSQVHIN